MDRAKVKNLVAVNGMSTKPAIPNVLNTAHLTRVNFSNKVGVELGNTKVEFSNSINAMKHLEDDCDDDSDTEFSSVVREITDLGI